MTTLAPGLSYPRFVSAYCANIRASGSHATRTMISHAWKQYKNISTTSKLHPVSIVENPMTTVALADLITSVRRAIKNIGELEWTYQPETHELSNETGREEKFGGSIPYFKPGDVWPTHQYYHEESKTYITKPLSFVGQWYEPNNQSRFVQYFVTNPNDVEFIKEYVSKRNLYVIEREISSFAGEQQIITPPDGVWTQSAEAIVRWIHHPEVRGINIYAQLEAKSKRQTSNPDLADIATDAESTLRERGFAIPEWTSVGGYGLNSDEPFYEADRLINTHDNVVISNVFPDEWNGYVHIERNSRTGELTAEGYNQNTRTGP